MLARGRIDTPGSPDDLACLAGGSAPGIVRSSALALLGRSAVQSSDGVVAAIGRALRDPDAIVRMGALQALESVSPADRSRLAYPLLADSSFVVRIEAVRILGSVATSTLSQNEYQEFTHRLPEYEKAQLVNADRPESHINLGIIYSQLGRFADARQSYLNAIHVNERTVEARVNLADLYRAENQEDEGEKLLREALSISPENAGAAQALALLLIRVQQIDDALPLLATAAQNAVESSRCTGIWDAPIAPYPTSAGYRNLVKLLTLRLKICDRPRDSVSKGGTVVKTQ